MDELQDYDDKICKLGEGLGLDWYPINYEIIDFHEMMGAMAYTGMPTHYRHWSYGKSFDRIQTEYYFLYLIYTDIGIFHISV